MRLLPVVFLSPAAFASTEANGTTGSRVFKAPAQKRVSSFALFQVGGERWRKWSQAMKTAVVGRQRSETDRDERGSWDPSGARAADLGRVATTALGCLDLEVYYRYTRVVTMDPTHASAPATTDGK